MVRNSALLAAIGICLACPALALAGGKQPAAKRPKQAAAIAKPSKQVDLPGPVDRNSLGFGSPQEDIERLMGKPTARCQGHGRRDLVLRSVEHHGRWRESDSLVQVQAAAADEHRSGTAWVTIAEDRIECQESGCRSRHPGHGRSIRRLPELVLRAQKLLSAAWKAGADGGACADDEHCQAGTAEDAAWEVGAAFQYPAPSATPGAVTSCSCQRAVSRPSHCAADRLLPSGILPGDIRRYQGCCSAGRVWEPARVIASPMSRASSSPGGALVQRETVILGCDYGPALRNDESGERANSGPAGVWQVMVYPPAGLRRHRYSLARSRE